MPTEPGTNGRHEDTAEIVRRASKELAGSGEDALTSAISDLVAAAREGGGGGSPPGDFGDAIKRQGRGITWKVIAAVIVATASSYTAMRLTVHDNAKAVSSHESRIGKGDTEREYIRVRVGKVETAVEDVSKSVKGIDDYIRKAEDEKQATKDKLIEDLQRQLRRERRRR
jgi:hypothetical protein